jgi:hypothetical protein
MRACFTSSRIIVIRVIGKGGPNYRGYAYGYRPYAYRPYPYYRPYAHYGYPWYYRRPGISLWFGF